MKRYYVYILTSKENTALYIGVTNDLRRRLNEHKSGLCGGFTKRYHLCKLVYFEEYSEISEAILREKRMKGWTREKKDALIEERNPEWMDLGEGVF